MSLPAKTVIDHYEILSLLGKGGMGEVYLSQDLRLDRRVAIKILPPKLSRNNDRIARFIQEAKAASSLNHPNIVTIYEIGNADGTRFIASELIEGETLHERMRKEPLTVRDSLEVGIQIASALNAAHQVGVIHRDIKPENIMIRRDGIVKVLDFGLAKLVDTGSSDRPVDIEAQTLALVATHAGLVMGTMPYMSPEQARGTEVDTRSDIWSFGVVLYEMITGRLPFEGETPSDTIASILKTEPPPVSDYGVVLPNRLEQILRKTLRKSKKERFQHVGDLQIDLKDVLDEMGNKTRSEHPTQRFTQDLEPADLSEDPSSKRLTTAGNGEFAPSTVGELARRDGLSLSSGLLAAAVAAALIVGAGLFWFFSNSWKGDSFQEMRLSQLTSKGDAVGAVLSISPDGKYVVYASQEEGIQRLRLKQIATSSDVSKVELRGSEFWGVSFIPNGDYLYYVAGENGKPGELYRLPFLGGTPRKVLDGADGPIAISPDGRQIAFVRDETEIMVSDGDGGNLERLAKASEGNRWGDLAWNNNGQSIAASFHSMSDTNLHFAEIAVSDGTETRFPGPAWLQISGFAWLPDGSGIVLSGKDLETELSQLWLLSRADGEVRRITNDLSSYIGVSIARDGSSLVSVQLNRLANIWIAGPEENAEAKKLTTDEGKDEGMSGVVWTPDGRIVYTVRERGKQDLWKMEGDGSEPRQLTVDAGANFSPAVSADGKYLVFASTRFGKVDLWRSDAEGKSPLQLTSDPGIEGAPSISPDGRTVLYYLTDLENKSSIWKVGIEGGRPEQITQVGYSAPVISPDGKWIACRYEGGSVEDAPKIAVLRFGGGQPVKTFDFSSPPGLQAFRWTPDSQALVFVQTVDGVSNIFRQSLESGRVTRVTDFKDGWIWRFDVSAGGFIFARGNQSSNVVMIRNFK